MCLIMEHKRLKKMLQEKEAIIAELELQIGIMPEPPQELVKINGNELRPLLEAAGLKNIFIGSYEYKLTSLGENLRFLKYYRDSHAYILDSYDCNIFALEQAAAANRWMHGEFIWGQVWGKGPPEYPFEMHGFNFTVTNDKKIYFCDELEVAAPRDDFYEAYDIECNLVMM